MFNNWYKIYKIAAKMTLQQALKILELNAGDSPEEVKKKYRVLAQQYHPDINKEVGSHDKMVLINSAYEYLSKHNFNTGRAGSQTQNTNSFYSVFDNIFGGMPKQNKRPSEEPKQSGVPPWQTDWRSSYNDVGEDFTNLNFCKKAIYEEALKNGNADNQYTISAFDGSFFRGTFTVFCNEATLGFAGMAMEQWNSHGANSYPTIAVFASRPRENRLKLIRKNGRDVSNNSMHWYHESGNPSNDQEFMRDLRKEFQKQEA